MTVASRPASQRFVLTDEQAAKVPADWFVGRFRVAFGSSEHAAVGVLARSKEGDAYIDCTATFLTTLGDYRYLAGNVAGGQLRLSCFDGAHAFLFRAERQPDGSLKGDFWSSDTWHEAWTAVPDNEAALPDGWSLTRKRDGAEVKAITGRDLLGNARSIDDERWRGKVRVLDVFGTWCPNCHDHAAYLAELHRRYAERGLVIIGLAFEHGDDFERSVQQVKRFRERHRADFPVLIAGSSDKAKATESLGLLDRVRAFPTTIFVDRQGVVRGVYQGWSGPATGDAETRLRERFEQMIDTLLAER
jgi:thiol-disulfide isomerase/thioredoxin